MHDRNNRDFWESVERRGLSRDLPDPDPWEGGEVAILVTGAAILAGIVIAIYLGWL